jgi:general stress protein YciG
VVIYICLASFSQKLNFGATDATPLCEIPIHPLPFVDESLSLLNILNAFQTGRSHMAIVAPRKRNPAASSSHHLYPSTTLSSAELSPNDATPTDLSKKTSSRSMLSKLFHRRGSSSEPDDEEKMKTAGAKGGKEAELAVELDGTKPLGIITLEDVLEELIGEGVSPERILRKECEGLIVGSDRNLRRV